ncbi:FG-GAP repeat domain-containing protein [Enhygromyxa salina]|uniref:FG-GAP repeat domain-containing protein n=1 Tax=Enhygromyxa salina TaxID=215803 RepID=UPI0015E70F03|nr:VCBS repeat-containing protein [Enhygromyxa salina]
MVCSAGCVVDDDALEGLELDTTLRAAPESNQSFLGGDVWERDAQWCYHTGSQLHVGDLNGDHRADMLCHDGAGNKWVDLADSNGHFWGTDWKHEVSWCSHPGSKLHLGDYNGDGRDDMLCHDTAGQKWIDYADSNGQFWGTDWSYTDGWCAHAGSELHIGDFNGDGRDDMLCHDTDGQKWIDFANGSGQFWGTDWYYNAGWCYHPGTQLHIGDFNGDYRDDMLCHDAAGQKWIDYANSNGQFLGTDWYYNAGWCHHAGSQLFVGDFNGDGREDMLCHDSAGQKWIDYADSNGQFWGTNWYQNASWCYHAGSQLFVGDFNNSGRSDLLCHDTGNGYKWITFSML